jgi:hypothetical protein
VRLGWSVAQGCEPGLSAVAFGCGLLPVVCDAQRLEIGVRVVVVVDDVIDVGSLSGAAPATIDPPTAVAVTGEDAGADLVAPVDG